MILLARNKFIHYRKFKLDLWGIFKSSLIIKLADDEFDSDVYGHQFYRGVFVSKRVDWICRFFCKMLSHKLRKRFKRKSMYFYRLDVMRQVKGRYSKKRYKKLNIGIKLMQMFYLTLSIKRIRKLGRRADKKDGLYESNFLFFLEFRILFLMYRSLLLSNIFEIIDFIKMGNVNIDGSYTKLPNKLVKLYSLVRFKFILRGYIYWVFLSRVLRKAIFNCIPRYLFFSFTFFFFFSWKVPREKDLINPFPLDVFKISDYGINK